MTILSKLGLMRVSEHERACRPLRERLFDSEQKRIHWQGEANEANLKYKRAITDLAAQADEIAALKATIQEMHHERDEWGALVASNGDRIHELEEETLALRPDAEAMRAKRKRDRDMKAAKRGVK